MKASMLFILSLLLLLLINNKVNGETLRPFIRKISVPESTRDVKVFSQKIDHFTPNPNVWPQRYTVNTTFYKTGGPTFIFLSGEAPMEFFEFQEVQALNWAAEFGANYISLEHRFYGKSIPTSDFSTESLSLLSSQQALADAANFVSWMQTENGPTFQGKWVVFGCSYSGALSAWFRLKFPNLVVASVAPSGPVEAQLNFTGYFSQFSQSASPNCVAAAAKASEQISQLMLTETGRQSLAQSFNSCSSTIAQEDSYFFLYSITSVLGGADQMSNPPDWTLNSTCNLLLSSDDLVGNFGKIVALDNGGECNDFSEADFISETREPSISAQNGNRAWTYQTCVEFGYFSTSYPGTSVFFPTLDVDTQVSWCEKIYGISGMTPDVNWTNAYYGGKDLKGTNIIFTNGNLDPWHLLSITNDNADGTVLAANYEAGHCGSMIATTSVDPPSLTQARKTVGDFLAKVLQQ